MFNIFHRLNPKELEEAVLEYLARIQRDDVVTRMINNKCYFSLTDEGCLWIAEKISPEDVDAMGEDLRRRYLNKKEK